MSKDDDVLGSASALRAEETAVDRVASALRAKLGTVDAFEDPACAAAEKAVANELARIAIDAYRAGPEGVIRDEWQRFARQLSWLNKELDRRGVLHGGFPGEVAIAHIDRLTTALDEAARDTHEAVELEAVYDGGLSTDQEIRATAAELWLTGDCGWKLGDWVVWIRDGRTPDEPEHPIVLDEPRRAANFVTWIDEVAPDFKLTDWQREILQRHGVRVSAEERSDDKSKGSEVS